MDMFDTIRQRRAIRAYKADPVPAASLRTLIEAASWAPSAMNNQAWHFVVITDRNLLDEVSRSAKQWLLDNEPELATRHDMRANLADPTYDIFHHAPVMIAIATPSPAKWSAEGCALAAENLMLAATATGLGSCWIGLADGWLNSPAGCKALGLAEGERVIAPIIVGYPETFPAPTARHQPRITWIEPDAKMTEDGERLDLIGPSGLYGTLIHP
jgi:nitroreductase